MHGDEHGIRGSTHIGCDGDGDVSGGIASGDGEFGGVIRLAADDGQRGIGERIVRAGKRVHDIAGTGHDLQRLVADVCQRTGRRHYAHGHTGIHGARAVCDLHGNGRGGARSGILGGGNLQATGTGQVCGDLPGR